MGLKFKGNFVQSLPAQLTSMLLAVTVMSIFAAPPAQAQEGVDGSVSVEELLKPGPLPEQVLGSASAPVTIVEYSSLTCPHCAAFHKKTFHELKKKYIDTGKVRFISREFPTGNLAAAAFMLARCVGKRGKGKYFPFLNALFATQEKWAFAGNPVPPLEKMAKQAGLSSAEFEACINDEKLFGDVRSILDRGANKFGVDSTPTFFINGKRVRGNQELKVFEKIIDELLAQASN